MGKSSLLNCLAGRRIAIVDATPGVTRDRISAPLEIGDGFVELVDTGGMGIEDVDELTEHVEDQIAYGMKAAELILFVVDARQGATPLDHHVARMLRKLDTPVILLANKVDQAKITGEIGELNALGFGEPLLISAVHNQGIAELVDMLTEQLAHVVAEAPDNTVMKLAVVGKRNAGKSTFINALTGEQRVIVSETPGTTRDSVDVGCVLNGRPFTLIDTAGIRKQRKIKGDIEYYANHRALRSIRRADVVAMMIDASLPISSVDKQLIGMIVEQHKPVLLVVNKWDLAREKTDGEAYAEYFGKVFPELRYAPISMTSATEGLNIHETIAVAEQLFDQASTRVGTGELNAHIADIIALRGPSHKTGTRPPKILYVAQISTCPPTIVCFVNDPRSFDRTYQRFLVNQLRLRLPYSEIPIRLLLRKRKQLPKTPTDKTPSEET